MINRTKTTLSLAPAIILLFIWIAISPSLREQVSTFHLVALGVLSALVSAWSVSMFAHELLKKE